MSDLPTLLQRYDVTLAPYRRDVPRVRYLDSRAVLSLLEHGLEVISTDIPGAADKFSILNIRVIRCTALRYWLHCEAAIWQSVASIL